MENPNDLYANQALWLASQYGAKPVASTGPVNDAQFVRAQPVATSGPIADNGYPPYSMDPSSAFQPVGPSTETKFDPVTGMPIFTQGDFLRYARIPEFVANTSEGGYANTGTKYVPFKDQNDLEAMYQKELLPYINLLGSQQFQTNGQQTDSAPAPKTFAEYLAQLPDAQNATDAVGPFASRRTVDDWIKENSNMSWNPQSKWVGSYPFDHMSAIGPLPTASNWTFDFNDDGSVKRLRQKTADKEGSWFDYTNSGGQYIPTGKVDRQYWDTNDREFNRNMGIIVATLAGGAALAAGGGVAGGAGAASAGTPITIGGGSSIAMSALPEYVVGAGGLMGPAAGSVAGGSLGSFLDTIKGSSAGKWLADPKNAGLVSSAIGAIGGLTSTPKPSAGTAAAQAGSNSVADQQMALAREQWEWQKSQDQRLSPVYEQLLRDSLTDAQKQRDRGDSMWQQYTSMYRPIEQRAATDAMNFDNPAELARREGMAQATVQRGFDDAEAQRRRDMARSGVSASSGRSLSSTLSNARALGTSQAVNNERTNTQATAMALRDNAIRVGRGIDSAGLARDVAGIQGQNSAQGVMQNQTNQRNSALAPALSAFGGSNTSFGTAAGIANNEWGQNYQRRSDQAGLWASLAGGAARYFSDEKLKEKKRPMDAEWIAGQVKNMRIDKWKYKDGVADSGEHIGPYAKEFADAFGGDGKTIDAISAAGVALGVGKGNALAIDRIEKKLDALLSA